MSEVVLPTGPLRDLLAWWRKTKTKGLIIGGLAVALRSEPRTTRDVDALVVLEESRWAGFLTTGERFSIQPRIPDVLAFAKQNRIFLLRHKPSAIDIDLSIAGTAFEIQAIQRETRVKVGRSSVPVATPEDLIIFKSIAQRSIDFVDIEKLLGVAIHLDCDYVRKHVHALSDLLEMPEIYADLDKRLREYEKTLRRKKK